MLALQSTSSTKLLVTREVSHTWILNSGVAFHVTPHCYWFTWYDTTTNTVTLGDNHQCDIIGMGDITLKFSTSSTLVIKNVRHVPELTCNLISCGCLDDLGYKIEFQNQLWRIFKGSLLIGSGSKIGSLYPLFVTNENSLLSVTELPNVALWHSRLGHMSHKGMEILSRSGYLPSLSYDQFLFCPHCLYGKQTCAPLPELPHTHRKPLQLTAYT